MTNRELEVKQAELLLASRKYHIEDIKIRMTEYRIRCESKLREELRLLENALHREKLSQQEEEYLLKNAQHNLEQPFD